MHPTYRQYQSTDAHPPSPGLHQHCPTTGCSNPAPSSATGCKDTGTTPSHSPAWPPLEAPELPHKGNLSPPQAFPLFSRPANHLLFLPPAAPDHHPSLIEKAEFSLTPQARRPQTRVPANTPPHQRYSKLPPHSRVYNLPPHLHPVSRARLVPP